MTLENLERDVNELLKSNKDYNPGNILKLLSEEVFDFSKNTLLS